MQLVCLFICHYHIILIIEALEYVLISKVLTYPTSAIVDLKVKKTPDGIFIGIFNTGTINNLYEVEYSYLRTSFPPTPFAQ